MRVWKFFIIISVLLSTRIIFVHKYMESLHRLLCWKRKYLHAWSMHVVLLYALFVRQIYVCIAHTFCSSLVSSNLEKKKRIDLLGLVIGSILCVMAEQKITHTWTVGDLWWIYTWPMLTYCFKIVSYGNILTRRIPYRWWFLPYHHCWASHESYPGCNFDPVWFDTSHAWQSSNM